MKRRILSLLLVLTLLLVLPVDEGHMDLYGYGNVLRERAGRRSCTER